MEEYTYEAIFDKDKVTVIKRTDADGNEAWIPTDPANSDYQAYLATLEDAEPLVEPVIEPTVEAESPTEQ